MSENVVTTDEDGVRTIRLDRAGKLNAMSIGMWRAVRDAVQGAEDAEAISAAVVTGTGRVFCSGDDIGPLAAVEDERDVREIATALLDCSRAIETASIPVVGHANGSAYGGGFELLLAADITVVPESATFALPETQIGAFPFYAAKRLGRLIGRQRAMDLALAGREIDAAEAVEWGLFARAAPAEDVERVVEDVLASLRTASAASLDMTKTWVNASLTFSGEDAGMRSGLGYLFAGSDATEGATAFLEDREPDYSR